LADALWPALVVIPLFLMVDFATAMPVALKPGATIEFQAEVPDELKDFDRFGEKMQANALNVAGYGSAFLLVHVLK
jgi:hypothetical protein